MNILETLYFVFKGDASELKKTTQESKHSADQLAESFLNVARTIKSALLPSISTVALISGVKSAVASVTELSRASESLNVDIEKLDAWSNAVKFMYGSSEAFQGSLRNLAANFRTTNAVALEMLPRLADLFSKVSRARAMAFGRRIGIDEHTIQLLRLGRKEIEELIRSQKSLGSITKEDQDIVDKFNTAWFKTGLSMRGIYLVLERDIIPLFTPLVEGFGKVANFFFRHSNLITAALVEIGAVISYFLIPAFARLAVVMLANPLTWLITGLTALGVALALVYDDWKTFERGGDSAIGRILKRWPVVGEVFKEVYATIKAVFQGILWFLDKVEAGIAKIKGTSNGMSDIFRSDNPAETLNAVQKSITQANGISVAALSPSAIFNNGGARNSSISIGEITVQTQATDPQGIAQGIGGSLQSQIAHAQNILWDGQRI